MYKCKIRRIVSMIAILLVFVFSVSAFAAPEDYDSARPSVLSEDHLHAEASVVIDAETGETLFSKNSRVRMYPASTTKIMTLLLAIESGWDFNMEVRIPAEAGDIPSDSSLIPVYKGEVTTFGDLLYGMMLHSGNDGANAVAVLVAGSVPAFVDRMNARAAELGCTGTHFTNAHGYHDENHYSTAMDLALITQEALKHESVRTIVSTVSYTMNVSPRGQIPLRSTNSMLDSGSSYYYEDCIGMKTGTHSKAGRCFVGAAEKDGLTLITVALNCASDDAKWKDTERMLDYGFTCYTAYTLDQMFEMTSSRLLTTRISNAHEDDPMGGVLEMKITQISNPEYERLVQTGSDAAMERALTDFTKRTQITLMDNLSAPITEGEFVGTFSYTTRDGELINASLIAGRSIEAQPEKTTIYDLFPFMRAFENPLVKLLVIVLVLLVIMLILYGNAKRRRRERRRREIYEQRRREYLRRQREGGSRNAASSYKNSSHSVSRSSRNSSRTGNAPRKSTNRSKKDDPFGKF